MHMTIVRWHIFFSHLSVLPIKPWMSLSFFGETHPLFTFPRPINQILGVCASKHLQLLTHHCILPQVASKEVEGRHSCIFSGGELLGVCWWWLGWGWKRPSQPPVYYVDGVTGSRPVVPHQEGATITLHIDTAPTSWHRDNEYGTESKSDFFWLVRSIRRIPPHLIPSKDYFPTRQRWDEGQQAILFSISWSELDPQIAEWGILQFGTDFLLLPRSTTILVSGKFELSE